MASWRSIDVSRLNFACKTTIILNWQESSSRLKTGFSYEFPVEESNKTI